jgi:hypothetical protein
MSQQNPEIGTSIQPNHPNYRVPEQSSLVSTCARDLETSVSFSQSYRTVCKDVLSGYSRSLTVWDDSCLSHHTTEKGRGLKFYVARQRFYFLPPRPLAVLFFHSLTGK